jgi:hypothetical protein
MIGVLSRITNRAIHARILSDVTRQQTRLRHSSTVLSLRVNVSPATAANFMNALRHKEKENFYPIREEYYPAMVKRRVEKGILIGKMIDFEDSFPGKNGNHRFQKIMDGFIEILPA